MAPITADALEDDEHVGKAYDLEGPDVLSFGRVTRMYYRAEGKRSRYSLSRSNSRKQDFGW